jgi:hypothetical protein
MEVYLVVGTSGFDDGGRNWVVKVYVSKKLAEKHTDEAEKRGDEIIIKALGKTPRYDDNLDIEHWHNVMNEEKNEFDPDFYCGEDDRATYYSVSGPFEVNMEKD